MLYREWSNFWFNQADKETKSYLQGYWHGKFNDFSLTLELCLSRYKTVLVLEGFFIQGFKDGKGDREFDTRVDELGNI